MESDLIKKSIPDCSDTLKCPSPTGGTAEHPGIESDHKPHPETPNPQIKTESSQQEVASHENDAQNAHERKKYHNIPNDIRMQLIEAVEGHGEKIKHVTYPYSSIVTSQLPYFRLQVD